jgi:hypothetical protein
VAVTDRRIGSSKASVEHPTDRIRNAAGEKTGVTSGQGDVGDYMQAGTQADLVTSEGALSRATAYWKD